MSTDATSRDAGEFLIQLSADPIGADAAWAHVHVPEAGGTTIFVGTIRPDVTVRGTVEYLDYEAYAGVCETVLTRICAEAESAFGAERIAVLHRTGRLVPGETAVVVAVACGHRGEAFAACRYVIDELKRRAPIWKREVAGGIGEWVACHHTEASHTDAVPEPPTLVALAGAGEETTHGA